MTRDSIPRPISRRRALQGAAATTAAWVGGLAAPMLNTVTAYSQSGAFNWQRFKGQTVEVLMETGPRADLMKKYQKEFLDQTGI
ncbi:MAG: twin-arginine translocation signal domain-containing protein [Alphaproteobacteria bacterium]|nr:twin-arginine translocation signal domain-containing protein [Alphaproteobacteria bacterium]